MGIQENILLTESSNWFKEITDYCHAAITNKRLSSLTEKQACQRFLNDYHQSLSNPEYPYRFDFGKALKVIVFIELLPHVKGKWAKSTGRERLIKLQPWQKFIVANIFGWVRKADGLRRFSKAFIEVPRKNGKTILVAAIGLYMLCADGEVGAEIYCGAGSLKQANEVFSPALKMIDLTPPLKRHYKLATLAKSITKIDGSKFEPVIGKPGDGASPSCAIVDEYHEHQTSELYDTMDTGMAAREQPVMGVVTTAGNSLFCPCYELHKDALRVLSGTLVWDELFAVVYSIDPEDDWTDPKNLEKANPNWGVSVNPIVVSATLEIAKKKPNLQNAFKTKHLNIWCYAKTAYYNALNWQNCHDSALKLENFEGKSCWIGLDLAKKRDLNAKVIVFKELIDNKTHYFVFSKFWLPEEAITHNENKTLEDLYTQWLNAGWLHKCDGNEMDWTMIQDDIIEDHHRFDVLEVPHDPHGASQISHELQKAGMLPVAMTQHGSTYTLPVNELEAAIDSGRIHHDGNPIMAWCIANVIVKEYNGGNKMPDKSDNDSKIDGASALLMAIGRAMLSNNEPVHIGVEFW